MTNPGSREDNKTHYLYAATLVERTQPGTLLGSAFVIFFIVNLPLRKRLQPPPRSQPHMMEG